MESLRRIESPANPLIKDLLVRTGKRSASGGGAFLLDGPHLLQEAMRSGRALIRRVFALPEVIETGALLEAFAGTGVELYEVSERVIKRLSSTGTPQGVVAEAEAPQISLEQMPLEGITMVLDGIQDPGNTGTIVRTAHAFGAGAVVLLPGTCDIYNPKALRATAGSAFHIPVVRTERDELVRILKESGIRIAVAVAHDGIPLGQVELKPPMALVFGSEAHGVSDEILQAADVSISIPIPGGAESLNVAQAAAVCLWEITK
jgi:TrmH family RNA methyltransferase